MIAYNNALLYFEMLGIYHRFFLIPRHSFILLLGDKWLQITLALDSLISGVTQHITREKKCNLMENNALIFRPFLKVVSFWYLQAWVSYLCFWIHFSTISFNDMCSNVLLIISFQFFMAFKNLFSIFPWILP